jgi:signal transduction histidine kinase
MELDSLESFSQQIDLYEEVIKPIVEMPENTNNIKNMKLELNIQVKPKIMGDANLLKIVVTNLINNAIKYGQANTTINIELTQQNNEYVFSVYNEGVGIPEEDMEKLFKKFSRLKQKGTEGIKGSGLGLYICKSIIEKHKGKIWVESEYGKWVKFSFSLPLS